LERGTGFGHATGGTVFPEELIEWDLLERETGHQGIPESDHQVRSWGP
jgi:hypothetical protein